MIEIELELIDRHHGPRFVRFWQQGGSLAREFGRVGGPVKYGHSQHAHEHAAQRALARATQQLFVDGYELDASNPELIAAITAAPDELANYLVYADWLLDHHDPRGELIQLMVARERQPDDEGILLALAQLREQHRFRFERWGWTKLDLGWRWGFVENLTAHAYTAELPDIGASNVLSWHSGVRQMLRAIRNHPSGRWVRRFRPSQLNLRGQEYAVRFVSEVEGYDTADGVMLTRLR